MTFSLNDIKLTEADVQRLMGDPSSDARAETAVKVSYQLEKGTINEDERRLATEVLRLLADDAAMQVRQAIVESLKTSRQLPRDVALKLASDIEIISLPLLELTPVLTDQDLIAIIQSGHMSKQVAIARRPFLSDDLSGVLAEHGIREAVETLVLNDGADMTEHDWNLILDRFKNEGDVAYNMAHRKFIPASILERLVAEATEEIKHILMRRPDLPEPIAQQLTTNAREKTTFRFLQHDRPDEDILQLVRQLQTNRRLNPSLILRAVCMGDNQFFEIALAVIARIPLENARILIHDKGQSGLQSLYSRSGLPMAFLPAIRHALNMTAEDMAQPAAANDDEESRHQRLLERIWANPHGMTQEDIDNFFSKLAGIRALSSV